jgi:hypothetical protein
MSLKKLFQIPNEGAKGKFDLGRKSDRLVHPLPRHFLRVCDGLVMETNSGWIFCLWELQKHFRSVISVFPRVCSHRSTRESQNTPEPVPTIAILAA